MATIYRCDACGKVLEPIEVFNGIQKLGDLMIEILIRDKWNSAKHYCRDCVIEFIIGIEVKK